MILDTIYDKLELIALINNNCEFTVSNLTSLDILLDIDKEINQKIKVHLAINTGMNRFGFCDYYALKKAVNKIKKSQNIVICGIFSHLFDGKCEKNSQNQIKIFDNFCKYVSKLYNLETIKHICASDGSVFNNFGDMVRLGYGLYDNSCFETLTLKTNILEFQTIKKGETAGYSGVFEATKKTKLAIIGIGYGDGILRNIVNKGFVLINGSFAKIVAVCMDSMIIDISKIKCKIYDEVIVIGKSKKNKISICDIARWCDTIGYEIIVRLSSRIDRIYIGEDKCKLLRGNIEQES